ncbi:right-handed parallel beta-helix repeat-containing protein [Sphingomonas jatrophae]|uniref:Right handed beta helix region n=1 Tax=Sphingomonas jatrophae TaxID=1166337 RepID=A0A1I6LGT6_9SPHN|nr:right-handed parallel beta-helix repeat-containing protein [Sphingomonas jatrophae]SFS02659.1 hypothetical protein SAMN05192580_2721 [Sphingomonas jatrophae]
MRQTLALAALLLATAAAAQNQSPPFVVAETGKGFYRLQDAVSSIGERDGTIQIAPGTYRDCAVVDAGRVAFQATQPGTAIFDGGTCEDKAALVLRGRDAAVEGLVFQNLRVPDGNGAGIRLERGNLTVSQTIFRNSEEGILTADDRAQSVRIDRSTFSGLGRCDRGLSCAHAIYVGLSGALSVTHSRFERGTGGHYVKSRAAKIEVTDSSFDDSQGKTTNYMIDLSTGAVGTIARNEFVQGTDKENRSALITVAPEARENRSAGLTITGNKARLAPGAVPTVFLADWSHEPLNVSANTLGKGLKPFEQRN